MAADRDVDSENRPSFFDTLTGFAGDDDDPVMRALDGLDAALEMRGAAIRGLKEKSDPPPPLPPAPSTALAA